MYFDMSFVSIQHHSRRRYNTCIKSAILIQYMLYIVVHCTCAKLGRATSVSNKHFSPLKSRTKSTPCFVPTATLRGTWGEHAIQEGLKAFSRFLYVFTTLEQRSHLTMLPRTPSVTAYTSVTYATVNTLCKKGNKVLIEANISAE